MQVFNRHQWNEGNFQVGFFSLVIEVLLVNNFKKVSFFYHVIKEFERKLNMTVLLRSNNLSNFSKKNSQNN